MINIIRRYRAFSVTAVGKTEPGVDGENGKSEKAGIKRKHDEVLLKIVG